MLRRFGRELQFDEAAIMYDRLIGPQWFGLDKYVSTHDFSYVIVRNALLHASQYASHPFRRFF